MSKKIITLQIGQCGNQIGSVFWDQLAKEHGISPDGVLREQDSSFEDRKDMFFYAADDGRYIPRAILIDLEPRILDRIKDSEYQHFYNRENILLLDNEGSGAGNRWTVGYNQGNRNYELISDAIRREIEYADSLEGFIICQSISGGTGSGIGSLLLEKLSDDFPRAIKMTYSVFPGDNDHGSVPVAPYNSILAMRRLTECADAVVCLDNNALSRIGASHFGEHQSIEQMNSLVSVVMAATTATLRFPMYSYNSLGQILAPLIPTHPCHFLMTGYTPMIVSQQSQIVRKTSVSEVMRRLLQPRNIMASAPIDNGMYISILDVIQGEVGPKEIQSALQEIHQNPLVRFVPWGPSSIQLAVSQKSPFTESPNRVSGLMLANHTSFRSIVEQILNPFDKMFKRSANINQLYDGQFDESRLVEELNECREVAVNLISQYKNCESKSFPSDIPDALV